MFLLVGSVRTSLRAATWAGAAIKAFDLLVSGASLSIPSSGLAACLELARRGGSLSSLLEQKSNLKRELSSAPAFMTACSSCSMPHAKKTTEVSTGETAFAAAVATVVRGSGAAAERDDCGPNREPIDQVCRQRAAYQGSCPPQEIPEREDGPLGRIRNVGLDRHRDNGGVQGLARPAQLEPPSRHFPGLAAVDAKQIHRGFELRMARVRFVMHRAAWLSTSPDRPEAKKREFTTAIKPKVHSTRKSSPALHPIGFCLA
eukprot:CAMPEP_0172646638 /NCGR_PEP_ID=MMETSP1068-20121228/240343_1 /TAXON_ID=35684 /ORGANISM="Pseudopedinella elastica, Strain CCMP716" /LENGTH=258 /DNA_ID=CAMNT_0013460903 /DNA_START=346 /DNA_END=1121 /DNA_ORIENTATION=+